MPASFGASATIRRLSSMIAALSSAFSAFESCVCNRERSPLAARNELVAHKIRKLNMSIRAGMRHLDRLRLPLSINFRLNSARRDSSVTGPSSPLDESVRLADGAGIMSRQYTLQRAPRRADGAAMPESRMFAREEMAEYDGDMSGEHTRLACWFRRLAETIFRSKFNSDRRD